MYVYYEIQCNMEKVWFHEYLILNNIYNTKIFSTIDNYILIQKWLSIFNNFFLYFKIHMQFRGKSI